MTKKEDDWNDVGIKSRKGILPDFKLILGGLEGGSDTINPEDLGETPKISEMNKNHAFIHSLAGRSCVMCSIYDEATGREVIEFRSPADIKIQYSNISLNIMRGDKRDGISAQRLGKLWIEHPLRRDYVTVVFDPTKEPEFAPNPEKPDKKVLNLWEGFSTKEKQGCWKKMRTHIWKILCNKNRLKFKYVMRWFAWTMQNVADRAEVALVFKGKQGAGKGVLFSQFEKIFGPHYMNISSSDHLTGKFNGHLRRTVFLFADEAYDPKDRESEGKLKQLITEPTIPIEAKFRDTVIAKNRLHIVMATNNARVIIAGEDSRRFFINEVDNSYAKGQGKNDEERNNYFAPIWNEMDNGGREAMMYDLLNTKLKGWHPRYNIPETEEMSRQRRMQFNETNAVLEWMELGEFPGRFDGINYVVKSSALENHMRTKIPSLKDPKMISWKRIVEVFNKLGITKESRRMRRLSDGVYITMEELATMRRAWDMTFPFYLGNWDHVPRPKSEDKQELEHYYNSRKWIVIKDAF